jgi:hypothetical protein
MKIPIEAIEQHIAVLGKTGSGKTYAAKGIVEKLLDDGRQVCVLDPTAAWWGLRLGSDGKKAGYPVVLIGGKHADIPLSERSGAAVARLVTEQHASVVIDTSGLHVGEYTRWFIDFAGTLYTTIRSPLHLVIDEAHCFMPQSRTLSVDGGKALHAGNRLMSGGRSLGIRAIAITQRPAKFHKDSLTCADTLIAMRMIAPQDRAAVKDWIDGAGDPAKGREVIDSLAGLGKGEAWVWYPEGGHLARTRFGKIRTYDSSATPKHGAGKTVAVQDIDLAEVRSAMADAVKDAEANDPKLLRAKIAELNAQLRSQAPPPTVDADSIAKSAAARQDNKWAGLLGSVKREAERLAAVSRTIAESSSEAAAALERLSAIDGPEQMVEVVRREILDSAHRIRENLPTAAAAARRYPRISDPRSVASDPSPIGKGERTVLAAIAQHPRGVTRQTLTVLTGYKRSSRDTYLQRLRHSGLVEDNGSLTATNAGIAVLGHDFERLPTGAALRRHWLERLSGGERAILNAVCAEYPSPVSREQLSDSTGYKRSSRDTYLQRLSARQLVSLSRDGVVASESLFD